MNPLERLRAACAQPLEHPGADALRHAAEEVVAFALDDFTHLAERTVGRAMTRPVMEALLREAIPEQGIGFAAALAEVRDKIAPNALRPSHPRFLAFVPGAPTFAALCGDWLCDSMNLFAAVWKEGAAPAQVELVVLDWLRQIIGYPPAASGILTSGGSEAPAARAGGGTRAATVCRPRPGGALCIGAAALVGRSRRTHRRLSARPDAARCRPMRTPRLPVAVLRQAIAEDVPRAGCRGWCLRTPGPRTRGPLIRWTALADCCAEHGLWLHADAAYGWAAALTEAGRRTARHRAGRLDQPRPAQMVRPDLRRRLPARAPRRCARRHVRDAAGIHAGRASRRGRG